VSLDGFNKPYNLFFRLTSGGVSECSLIVEALAHALQVTF